MLLASLLLLYILSLWTKKKETRRLRGAHDPPDFDPDLGAGFSEFVGEGGVTFVPPMHYQRIAAVRTLLTEPRWNGKIKKLADLGCGEFAFAKILQDVPTVEEYCAMDYMESQLREKLMTLSVLADILRANRRPIVLRVLAGSLSEPDDRLSGSDAIICIEVIEHLYPDVLECVPHTVFGCVRPQVAIFSTPNSEFNFLFGDARKFRDSDHKFEWTREQFKCWASNIVSRYPEYSVEFYGVGRGPSGTTHVGCCTQLVLFHRVADVNSEDVKYGEPYVHVHDFVVEPLPANEEEPLYTWVNLQDDDSSIAGTDSSSKVSSDDFSRQQTDKQDEQQDQDKTDDVDWLRTEKWRDLEDWDDEDYGDEHKRQTVDEEW